MVGKLRNILCFLIIICMFGMFCKSALAAPEPDFRLEMDSLNLQKGVSSTIVVSFINAENAQIVSIDGLDSFDVLSQSSSTSTTIINNESTYQMDMHYTIMPKTTGQFTLKATIDFDGKEYETNSLDVTVTENTDNGNGANPDLFVETTLSHEEAYLGEKLVITYEIYSRENIESLGFTESLTIDGMVTKELPDSEIEYETVYLDGDNYTKYRVKQLIIDPIKTGTYTIPSFDLQVDVLSEGSFGGFLQSTTPQYLQTEERTILVKPLPSAGKPDDFSGIVGELNLNGNYSRNELNYGDSLALQVEMSGNCNLDGLKNIFSETIPGFAVYENQKDAAESIENNKYYIQKSFEAVLIPEKNGMIDIAPVSISYFNPVTKKYETAEISGTTIDVLGDMPQASVDNNGQIPMDNYETVLINQVSYNDVSDGYYNMRIQKGTLFAILIGIAMIAVLTVLVTYLVLSRRKRNTTLSTIYKKIMKAQDGNDIYNSFNTMMKHCFGLNLKASSQNSIISCLSDSDLASQVIEIMRYMESTDASEKMDAVYLKKKIKSLYIGKLRKGY